MAQPGPPSQADALSRFRAAVDAAVEQGRRAAAEARACGAVVAPRVSRADGSPTSADLRDAAVEFRRAAGLPVPEPAEPPAGAPATPAPPDEDDDFSQERILRKL